MAGPISHSGLGKDYWIINLSPGLLGIFTWACDANKSRRQINSLVCHLHIRPSNQPILAVPEAANTVGMIPAAEPKQRNIRN